MNTSSKKHVKKTKVAVKAEAIKQDPEDTDTFDEIKKFVAPTALKHSKLTMSQLKVIQGIALIRSSLILISF